MKKIQNLQLISKNDLIADLLEKFPELIETLIFDFNLHCAGCPASRFETLEDGALAHGKTQEEINLMIKKLNFLILKKTTPNPKKACGTKKLDLVLKTHPKNRRSPAKEV